MTTTLAATLHGAKDLRLEDRELAPLAPGFVRVRFAAGGICGSDMHYFSHGRIGNFIATSPLVLGHEVAGTVEEIGEGVAGVAPGDRVAVNPSRWCGRCPRCLEGRRNLCENIYFMGSASKTPHMQGGFATLFDAIPAQCVPIPDAMPFEAAALAEPLAVCLHAVNRGDVAGKHVAVIGAGPIGLLTLLAARMKGATDTTMVDIAAAPLAFATRLGAGRVVDLSQDKDGLARIPAPDVVIEAAGSPAALEGAIGAVRRGGTVVLLGSLPGGTFPAPVNPIMAKELDVVGSFRFDREFEEAVKLIAEGKVDVLSIVTARRPLAQVNDAFALALDRSQSVKVVLTAQ
jgi:L-idonate 5-dehydrogenase